jgi:lipopolysaccharide transport system permease protein
MIKVDANSKTRFFEFLQYKELLYYLVWKELKVRYKQAFLGALWTILQPLVFSLIIAFIIVRRIGFDFGFEGVPAVVIVILSFSIWTFFESSFSSAANSLSANESLMKKIYLPKATLILSTILSKLVDFVLGLIVFIGFLLFSGADFNVVGFLILIPVVAALTVFTFFIGLLLGPLNVRFRDIKFLIPFGIRIMFFSTPIWYPFDRIPESLQPYFLLNPIVAAIEITRNGFFDPSRIEASHILLPLITTVIVGLLGVLVFRSQESKVIDYV